MDDIGIDLAYLVDTPDERLDVEYKSAIELGDKIQRAKLARHIAALANFGGGYVVTGFNDDLSPSKTAPSPISRDDVSSIVKTYLEPAFHCTVRTVRSAAGRDHYVIVIPSHGAAPICVKANGPDSGKKIEGVQQGTYYIRKPGPESAPIITATDWKDVIRRCALYERASILAALEHALAGRGGSESQLNEADRLNKKLETWHRVAAAAYRDSIEKHGSGVENLAGRNFQYSYLIDSSRMGHHSKTSCRCWNRRNARWMLRLAQDGRCLFSIADQAERLSDFARIGQRPARICRNQLYSGRQPGGGVGLLAHLRGRSGYNYQGVYRRQARVRLRGRRFIQSQLACQKSCGTRRSCDSARAKLP